MSIPAALSRRRDYSGPALFSYGFRPFFLGAAVWAALGDPALDSATIRARSAWRSPLSPLDWHIHEMLYGYVPAVVAGFLLTAIPNWTGRLPVCGAPLAGLALFWLAGRVAMLMSAPDWRRGRGGHRQSAFSFCLRRSRARDRCRKELAQSARAGRARRADRRQSHFPCRGDPLRRRGNYGVAHRHRRGHPAHQLVGGRIVPSFTRNWLVRENPGRLPVPFSRFDGVAIVLSAHSSRKLDRGARSRPDRRAAAPRRYPACRAAGALGRRSHLRAIGSCWCCTSPTPSCRSASCSLVLRCCGPITAGERRHPRLDGGRGRHDDAGGDDARESRPYRTGLVASPMTQAIYACLLVAAILRITAACTGSHGADPYIGHRMDPGLWRLRGGLWSEADLPQAGLAALAQVQVLRGRLRVFVRLAFDFAFVLVLVLAFVFAFVFGFDFAVRAPHLSARNCSAPRRHRNRPHA